MNTSTLVGDTAQQAARSLIDRYYRTTTYPYTRHHLDSFDQFLQKDLPSIIQSSNPIILVKDLLDPTDNTYRYVTKIYIGGKDGTKIEIGTPTVSLQNTEEVRLLFPNEARLRNLTYSSTVYVDIEVSITYTEIEGGVKITKEIDPEPFQRYPLFSIPIMLHSKYCVLHNKPREFLRQAGECPQDHGSYFIVNGAEKVLITLQEQAFNTLYITPQNASKDPKVKVFASISCLNADTRVVKRVAFIYLRRENTLQIVLPFVRKPIPVFTLFRALGFQSDEEILRFIYPDFTSPEATLMLPKLHDCIVDGYPFTNTQMAIQYIKTLTKGFSEATVIDIIRNQMFVHMTNDPTSQAIYLGDCVRRIIRVNEGFDDKTDRDDTRNQRCLTSGFLTQMLFSNSYKLWKQAAYLAMAREYEKNKHVLYKGENFKNIFQPGNTSRIFVQGMLTESIMRGFKGKWGTGLGEEKSGVLQSLSRLSYCDFMSHCRRVILNFDTSIKEAGPRKLHPSQYGYFCTNETPSGASIGVAKNLDVLTAISTPVELGPFLQWLRTKGRVYTAEDVTIEQRAKFVPVYVNNGFFGFTAKPQLLDTTLKIMKRSACIPYSVSITFSIRERRLQIFLDGGRPLRPLIWLDKTRTMPEDKLKSLKTWRDLVMGTREERKDVGLDAIDFFDPFADNPGATLEQYAEELLPYTGAIEYVDPYEHNETYIANFPEYIKPETTHVEVHPSTIMSIMTSVIPYPNHNQSPRNQLSCSQSKQGLSLYATNWQNRFDNTAHVLCYGEAPLTRTLYSNYIGEGKMPYGSNIILAVACWSGFNQDDGIVFNYDAFQRGLFRSIAYRSYELQEEDDERAKVKFRIGNPARIAAWKELKPGLDYTKLDDRGIIRVGEYCDENTVIVGGYMLTELGTIADSSLTPQVWTTGRVDKISITVDNMGHRLVKVRLVQDRIPELGDKFCLTDDHEVLTDNGWVNIKDITVDHKVAQYEPKSNKQSFVNPSEIHIFEHSGTIYEINTQNSSQYVTAEHRMWIRKSEASNYEIILAKDLHVDEVYFVKTPTSEEKITKITKHDTNPHGNTVHCLTVPSGIFLVRHKSKQIATWTGNSNRHGQKGTIGAMLRGHDMPRTKDGLIPDMIMNPAAIPSRMTMAQSLEQLFGKAAAALGAVGDATAFMNEGSPGDQIGFLLEKLGYEKFGNDILYNGATGEQIPVSIFSGPVYEMRLKHMVEDKWQARGKGRKEQRTHQPTGGRGNQGGLKIGEMDRDSIIAHSITSFYRESYMDRSDGTKIPLCTSCGTVPIYNPRMGIAVCPMCSGPVRFVGDRAINLELLPPLTKPKGRIVEIEIPYATKLLQDELATYMNIGMRFITSTDTQGLRSFELSDEATEAVKELPRLILPTGVVPEMMEERPEATVTVDQLKALGADVGVLQRQVVGADEDDGELLEEEEALVVRPMGQGFLTTFQEENEANLPPAEQFQRQQERELREAASMAGVSANELRQRMMGTADFNNGYGDGAAAGAEENYSDMPPLERAEGVAIQPPQQPIIQQPTPPVQRPQQFTAANVERALTNMWESPTSSMGSMSGGGAMPFPAPIPASTDVPPAVILPSALPNGPRIISVDTSPIAMQAQGLTGLPMPRMRGGYQRGGGLRMSGGTPYGPAPPPQQQQTSHQAAHAIVTVNKMG
jgi:DNA-directed RNA polymerase II subunit RPB2